VDLAKKAMNRFIHMFHAYECPSKALPEEGVASLTWKSDR
jgi:hypothetical protein